MGSLAADIGGGHHSVAREFVLHIKVPLLHVRPNGFVGNRVETQRKRRSYASGGGSNAAVARNVVLGRTLQQRRGLAFHAFGVGLVTVSVLVEDAIATTKRCFAVAEDVVGKADTRCGVEQMSLQATGM